MRVDSYRLLWLVLGMFVMVAAVYSWRVYSAPPIDEAPLDSPAWEGKLVYQRYNCVACHQLYGLGGYMGPDLTNVMGRRDEAVVRAIIRYGTPRMPAMGLTDAETAAVIAFLKQVNRSGTFPVRAPQRVGWGMYDVKPYDP